MKSCCPPAIWFTWDRMLGQNVGTECWWLLLLLASSWLLDMDTFLGIPPLQMTIKKLLMFVEMALQGSDQQAGARKIHMPLLLDCLKDYV